MTENVASFDIGACLTCAPEMLCLYVLPVRAYRVLMRTVQMPVALILPALSKER